MQGQQMHLPKSVAEGQPRSGASWTRLRLHRQGCDLPKFACHVCKIETVAEPDSQACVLRGMAEVLREGAGRPCSGGVPPPVGA